MFGPATEGTVQQHVHRMSAGHDERLVIMPSASLRSMQTLPFVHCL